MKKTVYMAPATNIINVELRPMMGQSVTSVGGTAGITMGEDEALRPTAADSRRSSLWDEDEE